MFTDATPERTERMFHYLDADNTGYVDYLGWSQTIKLQVGLLALLSLQVQLLALYALQGIRLQPQCHKTAYALLLHGFCHDTCESMSLTGWLLRKKWLAAKCRLGALYAC